MSQTRIFAFMNRADLKRAYDVLERDFEDEGHPIASQEIDEDADIHELSVYVEEDALPVRATVEKRLGELGIQAAVEVEVLPDIDWVAKSLEGLKPVRAGRILIHGAHDRDKRRIGDVAIEIEAGLAFGTGHHGTTAGCLEMIDRVLRREKPRNALDLGTGSAVLAIALAKLAHIPVLATDIDPVATRVANQNVHLNGVSAFVETLTATGFGHPVFQARAPFDLIVANILAKPLMRLAPQMARFVTPGGSLILSGILERQREAVIAAYVGQSFRHVTTFHRGEWVAIHLKR